MFLIGEVFLYPTFLYPRCCINSKKAHGSFVVVVLLSCRQLFLYLSFTKVATFLISDFHNYKPALL